MFLHNNSRIRIKAARTKPVGPFLVMVYNIELMHCFRILFLSTNLIFFHFLNVITSI